MKRNLLIMPKYSVLAFGILLVFLSVTWIIPAKKSAQQTNNASSGSAGVAVLELFTSQGCSSCPPADALLAEYANAHDRRIIPLSFHVDYWNRLGWADPFSKAIYSERQQWYSRHLPKGSVYTPQLIVNGRGEAVGSNRSSISNLVEKQLLVEQSATVMIAGLVIGQNSLSYQYTAGNTGRNDLLNIALVQKQATTHIKAGENEGVTITNHNIVRSFDTVPVKNAGTGQIALPASFRADEYALVLFVQNSRDLSITAAVIKDL